MGLSSGWVKTFSYPFAVTTADDQAGLAFKLYDGFLSGMPMVCFSNPTARPPSTAAGVSSTRLPCHRLRVSTSADFETAQARVKTLKSTPSPEELLELYALFKQGTQGDVTGSRPGMLDFKSRAKFDAWEKRKGLARDAAQKAYVELVATLEARYGLRLPE
jgi:acyl-CoA-binding protein